MAKDIGATEGWSFDLSKITGRQMAEFNKAMLAGDIEGTAKGLALVVETAPYEIDVTSPDSYLDLPYYSVIAKAIQLLQEASKNVVNS